MAAPAPKKKGVDLAIVLGGMPKKGKPPMGDEGPDDEAESDDESGAEEDLPPDFVAGIEEAFPEMAGDEDRMRAMKRAIHACMESY